MTPEERTEINEKIEHGFQRVNRRINLNTLIFCATLLIVSIILWRLILVSRAFTETAALSTRNAVNLAAITATQEINRQQYLDYIKDMIEAMNKLQADNADPEKIKRRGVRVPKWPVPRTVIPNGKTTESDLQRLPQPAPTPSPIVKTQTKTVIKYRKRPQPTPGPFERLFKSKATR